MNFIEMIKILKNNPEAKGVFPMYIRCLDIELMIDKLNETLYKSTEHTVEPLSFPALTASQILSNNWEILFPQKEVPKFKLHTFEEAIAALKRGKTIKRELWTTKIIEPNFCDDQSIEFSIDDFEANDWIIL